MDGVVRVGFGERIDNLPGDRERVEERRRAAAHPGLQCLSLDVLHDDERAAVVFRDFVDGADVGMIERRRRARLAEQTLAGSSVRGQTLEGAL